MTSWLRHFLLPTDADVYGIRKHRFLFKILEGEKFMWTLPVIINIDFISPINFDDT